MKIKSRLWRRIGAVLGAVAFVSSVGMMSNAASVSAQASLATLPDWNYYNESPLYAPSSMHQGHYSVYRVQTVSIDVNEVPIYVISVNGLEVQPSGDRMSNGRTVFRLNDATKEAWILDLTGPRPHWQPLPTQSEQQRRTLDKLFEQATGVPFFR